MIMDGGSYVMAWCFYLISALGLTCVFWRMTRKLSLRRTRRSIRTFIAVCLFTPINIGAEGLWLAPAYLVGTYDWVLGQSEKALQAGLYISVAYVLMIGIILLESVMRRLLGMERA